mmetsp:Transcript_14214/g.35638  ORF Transcript_14214/g.35638 Transcript_14214/m.35638 type:complete len:248 (-) Transcript_14214:661-1404(-)
MLRLMAASLPPPLLDHHHRPWTYIENLQPPFSALCSAPSSRKRRIHRSPRQSRLPPPPPPRRLPPCRHRASCNFCRCATCQGAAGWSRARRSDSGSFTRACAPRRSASHLRRALDRTIRSPSGCCVPYFRRRQSTQTVRAMRRRLPHPTRQPHHRAVVGSAKDRILRSSQARITRLSRRTRSSSNLRASCSGASKATSYATTSGVASTSTICWGPRCCFTRWRMPLTMQVQAGSAALPRMGRRLVEA